LASLGLSTPTVTAAMRSQQSIVVAQNTQSETVTGAVNNGNNGNNNNNNNNNNNGNNGNNGNNNPGNGPPPPGPPVVPGYRG
jgi:hypothetical protein